LTLSSVFVFVSFARRSTFFILFLTLTHTQKSKIQNPNNSFSLLKEFEQEARLDGLPTAVLAERRRPLAEALVAAAGALRAARAEAARAAEAVATAAAAAAATGNGMSNRKSKKKKKRSGADEDGGAAESADVNGPGGIEGDNFIFLLTFRYFFFTHA